MQARFVELKYPQQLPAFRRLLTDARDRLWIEEFTLTSDPQKRLWCYLSNGQLAGTLIVSPQFHIFQIAKEHIVGRWTNEDGAETVRVYKLSTTS
ncbi:MAG: hypothetical protein IT360_12440 [Gemmatimonadaceae bacterium]|nr:hypothetical protein [Gemmatimonadaceae bacterium]